MIAKRGKLPTWQYNRDSDMVQACYRHGYMVHGGMAVWFLITEFTESIGFLPSKLICLHASRHLDGGSDDRGCMGLWGGWWVDAWGRPQVMVVSYSGCRQAPDDHSP